jgi:hypothetical protein
MTETRSQQLTKELLQGNPSSKVITEEVSAREKM